jgi:arylsulfatase A-like enzyme
MTRTDRRTWPRPSAPSNPRRGWSVRLSGVCLAAGTLTAIACVRSDDRPSVLLITIDTLRADHLGCYGHRRATSPRIDRLASEGALFERVTTSVPRTTQSIASILTGRFPKGHGARGLFSSLSRANLTLAEILRGEGYETAAIVSNMFLRPGQGFEQGFDLYDNPQRRWDGDSASEVTGTALAWLRSLPERSPFFLWVHYLDPHWTYLPSPPFDRAFDSGPGEPFTLYDDLKAGRMTKGEVIFENRLSPREVERVRALYDGEIAQVSAALEPLLDHVAEQRRGPVLVVLTSDHGESLGEHDYYFAHGEYLYEPSLRIPLIVTLPGRITPGLRVDALAQNVDIAPTILALLGVDRLQSVDGRPLFVAGGRGPRGEPRYRPAPGRSVVFAETDFQLIHPENRRYYIPGPAGKWSSASDGRHKLIHIPRPGGDLIEFYDLLEDPGETRDLGPDVRDPESRRRLLGEVHRFADYDPGTAAPTEPDAEQRERLRSLGYVN